MIIRPVSLSGMRICMKGFLPNANKLDKINSLYHNIIDTDAIAQNDFRNIFDNVLDGYQWLYSSGKNKTNDNEIGWYILDIDSLKDMYIKINGTEEDEYFFAVLDEAFDPRTSRSRSIILEKLRYKLMYYIMVLWNQLGHEQKQVRGQRKN